MSTIINNEGKEVLTAFHDIHAYSHRPNIFGDDIACIVAWDFSKANLNEENRIRAITQVASICYQNPKALESASLYKRLAAESIGLPSSSFEFVPVLLNPWNEVAKKILVDQRSNVRKFGEWVNFEDPETGNTREALLTNYRAMCYDYEKALADIISYFDGLPKTSDNELQLKQHIEYIEDMYLKFFNTEEECAIIKEHFKVFLFNVDMPTRSQMVRHRVNWQELSRRYVSGKRVEFEFYISEGMKKVFSSQKLDCEIEEWCEDPDDLEVPGQPNIYEPYEKTTHVIGAQTAIDICLKVYFAALEQGVKPQEARRIIPQAAYTKIWGAFQPSQLQNFFNLRLDEHAQWEIRKVAEAMFDALESYKNFPEMTTEQEIEASKRLQDLADGKVTLMTKEEINSLLDAADEVEPNNVLTTEEINKLSKTAVKFLTGIDMVPEDKASLDDAFDLLKG